MIEYHVGRDDVKFGPYTEAEAIEFYKSGNILPNDLIWAEGFDTWRQASTIFDATSNVKSADHSSDEEGTQKNSNPSGDISTYNKRKFDFVKKTNRSVQVWQGYSWPATFLGPTWLFYKGMYTWVWKYLALCCVTLGLYPLYFPFKANSIHEEWLVSLGYSEGNGRDDFASKRPEDRSSWLKMAGGVLGCMIFFGAIGGKHSKSVDSPEKTSQESNSTPEKNMASERKKYIEQTCARTIFLCVVDDLNDKNCSSTHDRYNSRDPILTLIRRDQYQIDSADVNNKGTCVATLSVNGMVNGNSYSERVMAMFYKPKFN